MAILNHWLSEGLASGWFMLQNIREPAEKVMLAGNINEIFSGVTSAGDRLTLQSRRMSDDDPGATLASGGRRGGGRNTK